MIAWERDGPYRPTIWIADSAGLNARALVPGKYPCFSPDGTRIVFIDPFSKDGKDLHLIKTDGTGYVAL